MTDVSQDNTARINHDQCGTDLGCKTCRGSKVMHVIPYTDNNQHQGRTQECIERIRTG